MNKVILIGNLAKDVELIKTTNDVSVARFTLAVQRKYSNANGEKEADFINIVAWRTLADNVSKYLKKGKKCSVVGTLQIRSYDAQDGTKKYATEVVAEEIEFLSRVEKTETKEKVVEPELKQIDDDGLPF